MIVEGNARVDHEKVENIETNIAHRAAIDMHQDCSSKGALMLLAVWRQFVELGSRYDCGDTESRTIIGKLEPVVDLLLNWVD